MANWNPEQYLKFSGERAQPAEDLLCRLDALQPSRILDLGCGPGNSTSALARHFPNAEILGVDASEPMLQKAKKDHPELCFQKCFLPQGLDDLSGSYDLIFSNACIHWIPEQEALLKAMYKKLPENGTLAVQIPYIQAAPFYKLLYALVEESWPKLRSVHNFYNLQPEEYYDVLSFLTNHFSVWQTTYFHVVDSPEGVIDWYRGSGLRPYLEKLSEEEQERFLRELLFLIQKQYPVQRNGTILLEMPRVFFTATKE